MDNYRSETEGQLDSMLKSLAELPKHPRWVTIVLFLIWAIPAGLYAALAGKTQEFNEVLKSREYHE